jgi:hypothetical protein
VCVCVCVCRPVVLTTGVQAVPTHWKHTVLWLPTAGRVAVQAGESVAGTLAYKRPFQTSRDYAMTLDWRAACMPQPAQQTFHLSS